MNDFTKNELEFMSHAIYFNEMEHVANEKNIPEYAKTLIKKLENMYDNYCEHIWADGSGNNICCTKCNAYIGKR